MPSEDGSENGGAEAGGRDKGQDHLVPTGTA